MSAEHPILPKHASHPHTAGSRRGYIYFNTTDAHIYFDNGWTWGDIGSPFLINTGRFDLTAAQTLTLGTANITIVPAAAGYVHVPLMAVLIKRAGPAFGAVGAAMQVKYANTASSAQMSLTGTGCLDQTTEASSAAALTAFNAVTTETDATRVGGKALKLGTNGGTNYTGTGSSVTVMLRYAMVPVGTSVVDLFPVTALP